MKKIIVLMILLLPALGVAHEVENYLILNNIGEYKFRPNRIIAIENAGTLVHAGHFPGHNDKTYEGIYIHPQTYLGVTVQITKHAGSESDKWLLHEVEDAFRDPNKLGESPSKGTMIREINNNKIFFYGGGVVGYSWISSNNIVVNIKYTNLGKPKPEPLEIVNAYLQKFPSMIKLTDAEIKSKTHDKQWLKDEMERRMWLADKWYMAFQTKKVKQEEMLRALAKNLEVFLNYREKYHKISAKDEKNALSDHLRQNNGTGIKNKYDEYKKWWEENKNKEINLQ